jgi:hypothetical protein
MYKWLGSAGVAAAQRGAVPSAQQSTTVVVVISFSEIIWQIVPHLGSLEM